MRTSRITTAVAATCATALVPLAGVAAPAHAADGIPDGIHFSVKKLCRDDGATRVRVLVENDSSTAQQFSYRVVYPTGRERLYGTTVWEHTDRMIFQAITVRPDTVMKFTIGAGDDEDSGIFARRFSPLGCP